MKKILCIAMASLLLLCACAAGESVYVSISNGEGELVMAREAVELSDADGDGALTINDALLIAHDQSFEGGSAEGYLAEDLGYGLSLSKLWGEENGGSYGYYIDNAAAVSLADPVADGSHVKAFVYSDLEAWSDVYCYFDKESVSAGEVELTLTALTYDADWNLVPAAVEGAVITVDGADSGVVTDANGVATLTLEEGAAVVSAYSDSMTLVPPVCVVVE